MTTVKEILQHHAPLSPEQVIDALNQLLEMYCTLEAQQDDDDLLQYFTNKREEAARQREIMNWYIYEWSSDLTDALIIRVKPDTAKKFRSVGEFMQAVGSKYGLANVSAYGIKHTGNGYLILSTDDGLRIKVEATCNNNQHRVAWQGMGTLYWITYDPAPIRTGLTEQEVFLSNLKAEYCAMNNVDPHANVPYGVLLRYAEARKAQFDNMRLEGDDTLPQSTVIGLRTHYAKAVALLKTPI